MAALFAATVLILGTDDVGELALGLALCAVLVTVTLTDLERRVIPNAVLLVGAGGRVGSPPPAIPGASGAGTCSRAARAASCSAWRSPIRAGWAWET